MKTKLKIADVVIPTEGWGSNREKPSFAIITQVWEGYEYTILSNSGKFMVVYDYEIELKFKK